MKEYQKMKEKKAPQGKEKKTTAVRFRIPKKGDKKPQAEPQVVKEVEKKKKGKALALDRSTSCYFHELNDFKCVLADDELSTCIGSEEGTRLTLCIHSDALRFILIHSDS